jgi:hypothetical protein
MFDLLGAADNKGIAHFVACVQIKSALTLLDEAFHCFTLFAPSRGVQLFKRFFKPFGMALGLFQVFLECLGELLVSRSLCHLWERLGELNFSAVKIL